MVPTLPASPAARWRELHHRSYLPVTDPAAELAWIKALASGMTGPCNCAAHWAAYVTANPPTIDTPAEYQTWAVAAHNAVNARINKPTVTVDDSEILHPRIVPARVAVLSLDSRPDRWQALTASVKTSRILSSLTIERYRARPPAEMIVPDWWPAKWGPSHYATRMDHLAIIERSYAAGDETVLILEDDAIIQDGFDSAYMLACRSLPADWMGLWLTSDGHKRPPKPVAPGLVQCTDQAMLHAYLLSRSGMRRVWHHIMHNRSQIIDGATEDLHGIEPHFYATVYNAVRQFGCRSAGKRTEFFDQYGEAG